LGEFVTIVKGVDPSSIKFHVERGDFEDWFKMLGDKSLAVKVAELRGRNTSPEELRAKLSSTVILRVEQLQRTTRSR
jgi:hypothetical protein